MEIVCSWTTLFQLAKAEAQARKSGDAVALAKASAEHEDYKQMCLRANRMLPAWTVGGLVGTINGQEKRFAEIHHCQDLDKHD